MFLNNGFLLLWILPVSHRNSHRALSFWSKRASQLAESSYRIEMWLFLISNVPISPNISPLVWCNFCSLLSKSSLTPLLFYDFVSGGTNPRELFCAHVFKCFTFLRRLSVLSFSSSLVIILLHSLHVLTVWIWILIRSLRENFFLITDTGILVVTLAVPGIVMIKWSNSTAQFEYTKIKTVA